MNAEKRLAMDLLDAVWKEDVQGVENCLELGASPSWVFNGYPIWISMDQCHQYWK